MESIVDVFTNYPSFSSAILDHGSYIPGLVYLSCICYLHSDLIFRPCFAYTSQSSERNQTTTVGEGVFYNVCSSCDRLAFWEYDPVLTRSDLEWRLETRTKRFQPLSGPFCKIGKLISFLRYRN